MRDNHNLRFFVDICAVWSLGRDSESRNRRVSERYFRRMNLDMGKLGDCDVHRRFYAPCILERARSHRAPHARRNLLYDYHYPQSLHLLEH